MGNTENARDCREGGSIALEACLSLTLFLIVMLALYSMICMFTAQSMIAHALQQAGQSIALENYKNSTMDVDTLQKIPLYLLEQLTDGLGQKSSAILDTDGGTFSNSGKVSKFNVKRVAKERVASYLNGSTKEADQFLKDIGIVKGLEGLNFEGTTVSGDDITIQVSYKVRLLFYLEMFDFGEFDSTQKVCCRLWS